MVSHFGFWLQYSLFLIIEMNITWERLLTWWRVKCGMQENDEMHKSLNTKPDTI